MKALRETLHWYQEPLAIMVFAIPAMTVIAGLLTVWIAVNGADVPVSDNVSRFGVHTEQETGQ